MSNTIGLHQLADTELIAPALVWARLARYWGNSFIGIGPKYMDYMQSDQVGVDRAFLDASNDGINSIIGFDKQETVEARFNRVVNFYEHCCIRNKETSQNWPFDSAPAVKDLVAWRRQQENTLPREALTDVVIEGLSPEQQAMFNIGMETKSQVRAENYADRVKESLDYIESEIASRMTLTLDILDKETGFLVDGGIGKQDENLNYVPYESNIDPSDMDSIINQDTQWNMLGDSYLAADGTVVQFGLISTYLNAAHNIKLQMYSPEREREFSGIFQLTVKTWQQLLAIQETQPEVESND
jgi:hypothetical protein